MKISALKPLNSFSLQRNENKEYKSNVNHNINSNEIMKNSVAEMLGRSQIVSFKGTNQINGDFFEHRCNTLTGVKENIFYNKITSLGL